MVLFIELTSCFAERIISVVKYLYSERIWFSSRPVSAVLIEVTVVLFGLLKIRDNISTEQCLCKI
jgi:hypothetical protein